MRNIYATVVATTAVGDSVWRGLLLLLLLKGCGRQAILVVVQLLALDACLLCLHL